VAAECHGYGLWRSREKEGLLDEVRRAMRGCAVLFLGHSLADPDFNLLWHEVLDRAGRFALGAYAAYPGMPPDERRVWAERQVSVLDLEPLDLLGQLTAHDDQKGIAMPTDEAIAQQQRLLATHRRTLAILLDQQAQHTPAYAPPSIAHGIAEARAQILRIKAALRGWGQPAEDEPNDAPADSARPTATPAPRAPAADVLIVTVADVEARAVLAQGQTAAGGAATRHFLGDKTYHAIGVVGGAAVFMVQSEMGVGGPGGALLTVQAGIAALAPAAIMMVGIAFGVSPKDQQIGDVLIAQQLLGYELQRVGTGAAGQPTILTRGDRPSASTRLLDRCRAGALDWEGPSLRFGLVLSGEKLVDNQGFREQLRQLAPEAIGGEMEGAGLYAAAQRNKVDWIMIKAICDWADGNKRVDKETRQQKAAQNAARFAFHVIQQGGLARQ
jgi:nucleoside phosphorylase